LGFTQNAVSQRVLAMAEALPAAAEGVRRQMRENGLTHPIVDRLVDRLSEHAAKCARLFALAR
jgi:hypothetical protein